MIMKCTPKEVVLKLGEQCNRCNHCCKFTSGFLAEDDKKRIAKHLGISEQELENNYLETVSKFNTPMQRPKTLKWKKPYGPCIFLTKKGCRIQEAKPLHCRIGNCSDYGYDLGMWFYLNYCVNKNDPSSIREYAVFLQTNKTIPGGELMDLIRDKEKLQKILNYDILR